jgi:hypothetical protein
LPINPWAAAFLGGTKSRAALAEWSSHPQEKQKMRVRIPPCCKVLQEKHRQAVVFVFTHFKALFE